MIKQLINKIFLKPKIKCIGDNNTILLPQNKHFRKLRINIFGSNNKVEINENVYLHNTKINIGFADCPINNCLVKIGQRTTANGLYIQLGESESEVTVGEDCMISFDVEISCTDTHSILDFDNNLLNRGNFVHIGSRVWICKNSTILKNTQIPDDCIIAQYTIVTKCFEKPNCIIAGNSGKVVKEGIKWSKIRPEMYIK